ncbi:unnamed protein product [Aphanomyces euteiches]|uniref:PH domain-containing protein n=1 Tax=Aphanomyces euteiches TaxID=100861 RepID=A0A6G0X556_9STRA|nr:hypothetical protein Ae201684_008294 [Aphanomyces euteiches]KAH9070119.1 hypothetical protein Ae201684P_002489 [Aphanomyces euteiches]KAH9135695.1 hypothetical protein AeRB84_018955 [Aphanomyces euteiches]
MFHFLKKNKGLEHGPSEAEALEHVNEACNHRPVATFDVLCVSDSDLNITVERRGTVAHGAWMVVKSEQEDIPVGCQVALVNGVPLPDPMMETSFFSLDCFLSWPSRLTIALPPYKKGPVLKKSKHGWEKWNDRILEVRGGRLRYWDVSEPGRQKGNLDMGLAKLNWTNNKDHPYCLAVTIGEEVVVIALASELERFEWAIAFAAAIQMATSGLSTKHKEEVQLSADMDHRVDSFALGDHFHSTIPF